MTTADASRSVVERQRLEFETLVSDVSARLLATPSERLDAVIEAALDEVRVFFGADRCGLLAVSGTTAVAIAHGAVSPGVSEPARTINLADWFPWCAEQLLVAQQPVVLPCIDDLPPDAAKDRAAFAAIGTRSNLTLPIVTRGEVGHLIVLGWVRTQWSGAGDCIPRLRLLGEMFISAIDRRASYETLQAREAQLDRAASAGGCGLWDLNTGTGEIWATNVARQLYGFRPDAPVTWPEVQAVIHPDDRAYIDRRLAEVMAGDGRFDERYRIVRPDGSVRWVHVTGKRSASGRLEGASVDVTPLVEAERRATDALGEVQRLRDRLEQENVYLRNEARRRGGADTIVGRSEAIRRALALADQVAPTRSTVLLLGETGVGKERFAAYIHEASRRSDRTMIRVNCAAIPVALIESELFGREKGAFTGAASRQPGRFELAHGSTLFLDEIGDLPPEVQVKLLRVLEEGTIERLGSPRPIRVDVRIIAATHRDLRRAVADGTFREDLFYRLNVFPLTIPALRDRREDIPSLVEAFVDELAGTIGKRIRAVDPESLAALAAHAWPGNVRELRNTVERAMILATSPTLRIDSSLFEVASGQGTVAGHPDRIRLLQVLEETGWRIRGERGAAARLGLKPTTLEARLKKLGISRPGLALLAGLRAVLEAVAGSV